MGVAGMEATMVAYERALADGVPIVGLWHSGGARLAEGVASLHAVGKIFAMMTRVSGKIPQISVVLGPAAGGAAYGPALTDIVVLGPDGRVFVTGPDVVRSVTGEDVDALKHGEPEPHGHRSGVVHVVTGPKRGGHGPVGCSARCSATRAKLDVGSVDDRDLSRGPFRSRPAGLRRAPAAGRAPGRRRTSIELHPAGPEHHDDPGAPGRPDRRGRGEQPAAAGRLPGLVVGREGGAVRADVRRLRCPAHRAGRRARLPARCGPGVGRRGATRPSCCMPSPKPPFPASRS